MLQDLGAEVGSLDFARLEVLYYKYKVQYFYVGFRTMVPKLPRRFQLSGSILPEPPGDA